MSVGSSDHQPPAWPHPAATSKLCFGTSPDPTGRAMLPAARVTAGHTPQKQKFQKFLFTSLQGEEEIPVPLELLHELFVLQEERDPLVLQVLLPAPLLLQGALAPRDQPPWHGLLAALGALGEANMAQLGCWNQGIPAAAPGTELSLWPLCNTPALNGHRLLLPRGVPPSSAQQPRDKGTKGDRPSLLLPLGKGDRHPMSALSELLLQSTGWHRSFNFKPRGCAITEPGVEV